MLNNQILSTMLRIRVFQKSATKFELTTHFNPSSNSDDLNEEQSAVIVSLDFRRANPLVVSKCVSPWGRLPLPSMDLIQEEISFLFNFYKSLMPYESSPSSQSPDFQEI